LSASILAADVTFEGFIVPKSRKRLQMPLLDRWVMSQTGHMMLLYLKADLIGDVELDGWC
jgi:hypothetical protein